MPGSPLDGFGLDAGPLDGGPLDAEPAPAGRVATFREGLRAFLVADPALAAIVAGRVRYGLRWQSDADDPTLCYAVVEKRRVGNLAGPTELAVARVAFDAWARNAPEAAEAIVDRLGELFGGRVVGDMGGVVVRWAAQDADDSDLPESDTSGDDEPESRVSVRFRFKFLAPT